MHFGRSPRQISVWFLVVCWWNNNNTTCTGGGITQPASSLRAHRICTMHPVAGLAQVPLFPACFAYFVLRDCLAHLSSCEDHGLRHRWFWLRLLDGPTMCSIPPVTQYAEWCDPGLCYPGNPGWGGVDTLPELWCSVAAPCIWDALYSCGKSGGCLRESLSLLSTLTIGGANSAHFSDGTSYWQIYLPKAQWYRCDPHALQLLLCWVCRHHLVHQRAHWQLQCHAQCRVLRRPYRLRAPEWDLAITNLGGTCLFNLVSKSAVEGVWAWWFVVVWSAWELITICCCCELNHKGSSDSSEGPVTGCPRVWQLQPWVPLKMFRPSPLVTYRLWTSNSSSIVTSTFCLSRSALGQRLCSHWERVSCARKRSCLTSPSTGWRYQCTQAAQSWTGGDWSESIMQWQPLCCWNNVRNKFGIYLSCRLKVFGFVSSRTNVFFIPVHWVVAQTVFGVAWSWPRWQRPSSERKLEKRHENNSDRVRVWWWPAAGVDGLRDCRRRFRAGKFELCPACRLRQRECHRCDLRSACVPVPAHIVAGWHHLLLQQARRQPGDVQCGENGPQHEHPVPRDGPERCRHWLRHDVCSLSLDCRPLPTALKPSLTREKRQTTLCTTWAAPRVGKGARQLCVCGRLRWSGVHFE